MVTLLISDAQTETEFSRVLLCTLLATTWYGQYCTAHTCHQHAYISNLGDSTHGQMMFHVVRVQNLCTILELTLDKLHV